MSVVLVRVVCKGVGDGATSEARALPLLHKQKLYSKFSLY